jgi:hypothetical protein
MANVSRIIREEGIVLEKIFKPAMDSFKTADGSIVKARPDTWLLRCVSSGEFKKDMGFVSSNVLDYVTDEDTYKKAIALAPVIVKFELSAKTKPVSVELKENK